MTTLVAQPFPTRTFGQRHVSLVVAHQRLMIIMLLFLAAFGVIGLRLMWLGVAGIGAETTNQAVLGSSRGDIVDRNGEVLARTINAWSIGIHANKLLTKPEVLAPKLAALMPEKTEAEYLALLQSGMRFTYLRRRALPDLVAQVNALGEPAMAYAREPERLYPQTTLAAHVLGYTDFDGRGVAGMERVLNARLSDPNDKNGPVALSIDARVQAAMEAELAAGMIDQQAKGATGLVLDVDTGEIVSLVSLPVFNPNRAGEGAEDARRNNVTQSVYELGSTFKALTFALALDSGIPLNRRYDATEPVAIGRFRIKDDHPTGRWLNIPEALIHSSNIVTARVADQLGQTRMETMFKQLHFDAAPDIELKERGRPIWPNTWSRSTTMTVGYGHGMAVTPLHLATAYAALVNGGIWRSATLMKIDPGKAPQGRRVFSQQTSDIMRTMLRLVVLDGTGRKADADGLRVGGKTGTAEKAGVGGYQRNSTVSTFAGAFPMDAPRYVVIAMFDEPKGSAQSAGQRTAGWVAAPIVSRVVSRIGPLLGVTPDLSRDVDRSAMDALVWKARGE
jgi:cell division protein FtsI (penicillin-binding protein 3)